MSFDVDVRRVLGDNVVDTLLREVDEGRIKEQHAEVKNFIREQGAILNVTDKHGATNWTGGLSRKSCRTGTQ